MFHLWVSFCVSLLDAIICTLCAFPRKRCWQRGLHSVHLSRKIMFAITYGLCTFTLCTSLGRQCLCDHCQHSLVDFLCMLVHCFFSMLVCECLGRRCQKLLMLPCRHSLIECPHPQCSFATSWWSFKQDLWPNYLSNRLNVYVYYLPNMPLLEAFYWSHHCCHKY